MFCSRYEGPEFGKSSTGAELTLYSPMLGQDKCVSRINGEGYQIQNDDQERNMLTNEKSTKEQGKAS